MRVRLCVAALTVGLMIALSACRSSSDVAVVSEAPTNTATATSATPGATATPEPRPAAEPGPGGWGFDRSDPEAGIANIMDAFATDEVTATCIFDAWGDVANVPPAELTPELMVFEICGTSIFQLITGDPRFTGSD